MSRAFTCLSDPNKRQVYDVHGTEQPTSSGFGGMRRAASGYGGGGGYYEPDIDADEIFRMFFGGNPFGGPGIRVASFGGAFPGQYMHQQQRQRPQNAAQQQQAQDAQSMARLIFSLIPFFLIIFFNLLSRSERPVYSLSVTRQHTIPQVTTAHSIPYYVENNNSFNTKYPPGSRERVRLEHAIETDWRQIMQQQCYNERMTQERYRYYGHHARADKMVLHSCKAIDERFNPPAAGGGKEDGSAQQAAAQAA